MDSLVRPTIRPWTTLSRRQRAFLPPIFLHALLLWVCTSAWPYVSRLQEDRCPSAEWNAMCRSCCEYQQIGCRCPAQGTKVGYAVPCCPNELGECDPCIIHQGCSIFENCKACNNGTWRAQDDFYIREQYCSECRQGWSGGDCMTCGGVMRRAQGHFTLESYPINARCDWIIHVNRGVAMELRFTMLSLEFDHSCRYDFVEVRDGDSADSPVIGRYCGSERPPPIRSSGDSLHVRFVSDGYNNFDGFFATFQEVTACSSSPCQHGGTCFLDPLQAFRCACPADHTGPRCQTPVLLKRACGAPPRPLDGEIALLLRGPSGNVLSVAQYSCHKSYRLQGTPQRTCLANGTWSGVAPTCVKARAAADSKQSNCPELPKLQHGYQKVVPQEGPHTVEFHCRNSHALSGNKRRTCLPDGTWSGKQPQCVKACREPKVSKLVKQSILPPHVALSRRNTTLHGLYSLTNLRIPGTASLDQELTAPTDPLPDGFQPLYTQIEYQCASPLYQHFGSARRTCLKTGKWSGQHVSCSPVCGAARPLRPQALADTRWPWQVAIYRYTPPQHPRYHHRHGAPSEEEKGGGGGGGGRWELACSGALVNQYSVVVAAHCVVHADSEAGTAGRGTSAARHVRAADVKVVMGKDQLRGEIDVQTSDLLRVAAILVHPDYKSTGPDSDLAVLKLLDKARISQRVAPVCLPRLQGGEVTAQQGYALDWSLPQDGAPQVGLASARTGLIELSDVLQCERQHRRDGVADNVTDNMLCGRQHPLSPWPLCQTYSGGGVVVAQSSPSPRRSSSSSPPSGRSKQDEGDGKVSWELVGLVNFGYGQGKCSPGLYMTYTRVNNFKDWLEKNMK
ncbi:inactive serine protease PAMR1 [Engraulis encrasicolus]|uniref:inactive serine protease PAMR1 n=1 Tax=Engraulis encrasicolus TaxID=184585 RepID=UPI002FD3EDBF